VEPVPEIRQAARDGLEHASVALRDAWAGDVDRLGGFLRVESVFVASLAKEPLAGFVVGDISCISVLACVDEVSF